MLYPAPFRDIVSKVALNIHDVVRMRAGIYYSGERSMLQLFPPCIQWLKQRGYHGYMSLSPGCSSRPDEENHTQLEMQCIECCRPQQRVFKTSDILCCAISIGCSSLAQRAGPHFSSDKLKWAQHAHFHSPFLNTPSCDKSHPNWTVLRVTLLGSSWPSSKGVGVQPLTDPSLRPWTCQVVRDSKTSAQSIRH